MRRFGPTHGSVVFRGGTVPLGCDHWIVPHARTALQFESWIPLLILPRRRCGRSRMPMPDRHTCANGNKWFEHPVDHTPFDAQRFSERTRGRSRRAAVGPMICQLIRLVDRYIDTRRSSTVTTELVIKGSQDLAVGYLTPYWRLALALSRSYWQLTDFGQAFQQFANKNATHYRQLPLCVQSQVGLTPPGRVCILTARTFCAFGFPI
ncbi:hypothetical protein Pla52n_70190 [Stieleria varia]|uniref:Uncharacterized protein n=1 Tax=Stieleria varia TaxID=2528005 RepID=A0A5C5ZII4_9BACT|nr:hypothetical protein Pla52n_70190 [Stieleria varia]